MEGDHESHNASLPPTQGLRGVCFPSEHLGPARSTPQTLLRAGHWDPKTQRPWSSAGAPGSPPRPCPALTGAKTPGEGLSRGRRRRGVTPAGLRTMSGSHSEDSLPVQGETSRHRGTGPPFPAVWGPCKLGRPERNPHPARQARGCSHPQHPGAPPPTGSAFQR